VRPPGLGGPADPGYTRTVRPRLARAALMLAAVFVVGTLGYRLIEGAPWWDAFFMTVITLTTVGYDELVPLSPAGQVFTTLLLFAGLGLLLFIVTEVARAVVGGELRHVLGRARRTRMIERLSDHEIVCGYGRMGNAVVAELRRGRRPVVVIDSDPAKVHALEDMGVPVIQGDATNEAMLRAAGVDRARGLVACLNDDAHNVYTILTARSLNERLFVVARAGEEGAQQRLLRAGANRVVNPYQLGGLRLAQLLVKPAVVDFLDFSLGAPGTGGLELEQVRLAADNPLVGSTLAEADLRRRSGIGVVALRRGEQLFPNPEASMRLETDDVLIVLGSRAHLESFERVALTGS
jgi:voltage-gated potassium channel